MNLASRGIDARIAHGDTFHNDRRPDLGKAARSRRDRTGLVTNGPEEIPTL